MGDDRELNRASRTPRAPLGPVDVALDDEDLLVLHKPAGLLSQPAPGQEDCLLARAQGDHAPIAGLSQRLDRPVSGLVAFARDKATLRWLDGVLRNGAAIKCYLALVRTGTAPVTQRIDEPIAKIAAGLMRASTAGQPSCTDVVPIAFDPAAEIALVGLRLRTGRTHQARVHLAWAIGAIVGDRKYGDSLAANRIALHAALLALPATANGPPRRVVAPPPEDFWALAAEAELPRDTWEGALDQLADAGAATPASRS